MKQNQAFLPYMADLYTLFCVALSFIFLVTPFFIELSFTASIVWILFSCLINVTVSLINHNHSHVATFGYRWANTIFEIFLTLTRGASASFIVVIHNLNHHKYNGKTGDWFHPSFEGRGTGFSRLWRYLFNTFKAFKNGAKNPEFVWPAYLKKKKGFENSILIIFTLFFLYLSPVKYLFFIFLPCMFGNLFVVFTNLVNHKNCNPDNIYESCMNYLNPIENFLLFNGGYHVAHHINANIHWSELPEFYNKEVSAHIDQKYEKGSMLKTMLWDYLFNFQSNNKIRELV